MVDDWPPVPEMQRPSDSEGFSTDTFLRELHLSRVDDPIVGADEFGMFRESQLAILSGDAVPIVVDTNILLRDLEARCKRGCRTTIVSGANMGALRLYCTPHVVDEVDEKATRWSTKRGIDRMTFVAAWQAEYIPLLRYAPPDRLEEMLLPDERARIDVLRRLDQDDVPAAIVATAMGAIFLTEDRHAREAVYGSGQDPEMIRSWLGALMAGTDAALLEEMLHATMAIPVLAMIGVAKGGEYLYSRSRFVFLIALAAMLSVIGGSYYLLSKEKREAAWQVMRASTVLFGNSILLPHSERDTRVRAALPAFPDWDRLVTTSSRDAALARACLYKMARVRPSPKSIDEIVNLLPSLGIGQEAPRVGKALRKYAIFHEGYRGEWQAGSPIPSA